MIPGEILRNGLGALLAFSMFGCAGKHLGQSRLPDLPETVPGYSALCAAKWQNPEKTWRARVAVAFLAPERIRLEVLDPAGNSRSVLIATEEGALLLDPPRRTFRLYSSASQATTDLVGIAAMPQSLAKLLLGPAALLSAPECGGSATKVLQSERHCPMAGGGELLFPAGEVQRATWTLPGDTALELWWNSVNAAERSVPAWVEIRQDSPSVLLHLETKEMRFSVPDPQIFSLSAPAGFAASGIGENL